MLTADQLQKLNECCQKLNECCQRANAAFLEAGRALATELQNSVLPSLVRPFEQYLAALTPEERRALEEEVAAGTEVPQ